MPPVCSLSSSAVPPAPVALACRWAQVAADLPAAVAGALWRGDQLDRPRAAVWPSGYAELDAQLPGGGWPAQGLTEILCPQPGTLEWRLLGPMLRQVCALGRTVVVVAPPCSPHLPGLRREGVGERHLVWVQAQTPAECLWSAEQLVKANVCGALIVWLPRVRAAQVRRLQVLAAGCEGPVFLCRSLSSLAESSAAPLRLQARVGADWTLLVDVVKRRGPPLGRTLHLSSVPGGLVSVLSPRLRTPSALIVPKGSSDVVVSAAAAPPERHSLAH